MKRALRVYVIANVRGLDARSIRPVGYEYHAGAIIVEDTKLTGVWTGQYLPTVDIWRS